MSNAEAVVSIPSDNPDFDELLALFGSYWNGAKLLDERALRAYERLYRASAQLTAEQSRALKEFEDALPPDSPTDTTDVPLLDAKSDYLETFRKAYQESVTAFRQIRAEYERDGRRKVDPSRLPLRLEIDSFFSFVRDKVAILNRWQDVDRDWAGRGKTELHRCLSEWHAMPWPHLENTIVEENFPRIRSVFASPATIAAASRDELFDALTVLHSFHDSLRFHGGGVSGLCAAFEQNNPDQVRASLTFLAHGSAPVVERMAAVIFDERLKLRAFGRANVQEFVGWLNAEELPVINGRTTKILRYFGFDVRQL